LECIKTSFCACAGLGGASLPQRRLPPLSQPRPKRLNHDVDEECEEGEVGPAGSPLAAQQQQQQQPQLQHRLPSLPALKRQRTQQRGPGPASDDFIPVEDSPVLAPGGEDDASWKTQDSSEVSGLSRAT
jgi:hypothetical protein